MESCVAKVVKTFGCVAWKTETLDKFRYRILLGESQAAFAAVLDECRVENRG